MAALTNNDNSTSRRVVFSPCGCRIKKEVWSLLRSQGEDIVAREPLLSKLVSETILKHNSFGEALAYHLAHSLSSNIVTFDALHAIFLECLQLSRDANECVEKYALQDLCAVEERDPACRSIAQALLYFKGFKAIQGFRMSRVLWTSERKDLALLIQARVTEVYGVDIHPGAQIGGGLVIDHGTGVVIGETSVVGSCCTFLHGVTLGGTGKSTAFDRHPKVGNSVFLGCQVTILGNITIGNHSTVGAASLVLKPLPAGATAVGSPAVVKAIDPRYAVTQAIPNTTTHLPQVADVGPEDDIAVAVASGLAEAVPGYTTESTQSVVVVKLWDEKPWRPKAWSLA